MKFRQIQDAVFGAGIISAMVFSAVLPVSREVQRLMMEKLHYTTGSFPTWAALQLVPSMYNFKNESSVIWKTGGRIEIKSSQAWPHHPFHDVGHSPGGNALPAGIPPSNKFVRPVTRLTSRYRGAVLVSDFEVHRSGEGEFEIIRIASEFEHD